MTHAKKAAEKIHPESSKEWYETQVLPSTNLLDVSKAYFKEVFQVAESKRNDIASIIQINAIKPAVDEATRELKRTLCKIAKGFGYHGILACKALGIDHTQNAVKVIEDIAAAEKLLEK